MMPMSLIEGRGIGLHTHHWSQNPDKGRKELRKDVEMMAEENMNFIIAVAKPGFGEITTYYKSSIYPKSSYYKWDALEALIEESHSRGLEVHAMFCPFPGGKDNPTLRDHPELCIVDRNGKRFNWADPAKPEVKRIELEAILEVVNKYDVDGVYLDYIRYPGSNYCYCDYCVSRFREEYGVDPREIPSRSPLREKWDQWRREQFTDFVKLVYDKVHEARPQVKVSSYCWTCASPYTVYQDWPAWARRGYLDFLVPTGYFYDMSVFRSVCQHDKLIVGGSVPIYIVIGVHTSHGRLKPGELAEQIKIVREEGLEGFVLFEWQTVKTSFHEEVCSSCPEKAKLPHKTRSQQ